MPYVLNNAVCNPAVWNPAVWNIESGEETVAPTVTTGAATAITYTTATVAGNVTDDGGGTISACGICYSTSENPTTADDKEAATPGTGEFSVDITGLTEYTYYHFRAYATNEEDTSYGEDHVLFTGDTVPQQCGLGMSIGIGIEDSRMIFRAAVTFSVLILGGPLGLPLP